MLFWILLWRKPSAMISFSSFFAVIMSRTLQGRTISRKSNPRMLKHLAPELERRYSPERYRKWASTFCFCYIGKWIRCVRHLSPEVRQTGVLDNSCLFAGNLLGRKSCWTKESSRMISGRKMERKRIQISFSRGQVFKAKLQLSFIRYHGVY